MLLTVWLRDRHDTYLSPEQGGPLISGHSAVPVYGIIDMYFGTGIVGGNLLNSATHGRVAAEKAVTWRTQDVPKNLPVVKTSINPYMFDYAQLKRWHVAMDRLPENSVVINRPVSLYDRYKTLIYSLLGVFVLLVVLIGYLGVNIAHRKKVEQLLAASERKWRDVLVNTPQIGVGVDRNGAIVFVNPSLLTLTGWTEAEVIGRDWFDRFVPEPVRKEVRQVFDTVMATRDTAALPKGTEYVLLVDDEPVIVEMLQHALERLGYRVTGFTASMDALTRVVRKVLDGTDELLETA